MSVPWVQAWLQCDLCVSHWVQAMERTCPGCGRVVASVVSWGGNQVSAACSAHLMLLFLATTAASNSTRMAQVIPGANCWGLVWL